MLSNTRAQTTTEFAILGALIIVAFAFLINYSEKLNRQQAYLQQTFRAALVEARNANNSASYTKVVFNRMPNVSNPMELGQLQSFSNSSNVLWQDGKSRNPDGTPKPGVAKYQLNEDTPIDIVTLGGAPAASGTTETITNTFTNVIDAKNPAVSTLIKAENLGGAILTKRTLNVTDTLTANVAIGSTQRTITHTLGDYGKYYPGQHTLTRSRDMQ